MKAPHTSSKSTGRSSRRWAHERGSILIPAAIALLGLLTFSAFTIDNGIMLSSRREAQNAADSAALAAALYLAWDDSTDQAGAQASAVAAAQLHDVWGDQPDVTLADVTFPTCPPGAPGLADDCVRVEVFRNQRAGGNPLPAFFASLAGVTDQGVRATATAQIVYGTAATDCLLPFAIPDKHVELREAWDVDPGPMPGDAEDDDPPAPTPPPVSPYDAYPYDSRADIGMGPVWTDWDPDDTYDVVEQQGQQGGDPLLGVIDRYEPGPWQPSTSEVAGPTGYNAAYDRGTQMIIKAANGGQIAPSFYYPIVLPDGLGSGASDYGTRITQCTGATVAVNTNFTVEPGNMIGPTTSNITALVATDQNASWDDSYSGGTTCIDADCTMTMPRQGRIQGGCAPTSTCPTPYVHRSPRHRAIAVFDIDNYMTGARTGRGEVLITGFIGFFVEPMQGDDVVGRVTDLDMDLSATNLTDNRSTFLRDVILVR